MFTHNLFVLNKIVISDTGLC